MTTSTRVDLIVRGGRVVCPASKRDGVADLHIAGDRIVRIVDPPSSPPSSAGARVVDASGCIVIPGLVDLGVCLRDPGREDDEDLASTLGAALRGGVTTVVALPDTDPPVDGSDDVISRRTAVRALGIAPDVIVCGALTKDRAGKEPADIADMASAGAFVFGDGIAISDALVIRKALEYARGAVGKTALAIVRGPHAELSKGGVVVEGAVATRLGLPGIPELADALAVSTHTALAS
ncbi:MAG TPA: dihydroorotase, partial [Myxococcota bacterium]